jgi:hypothetical protein
MVADEEVLEEMDIEPFRRTRRGASTCDSLCPPVGSVRDSTADATPSRVT